MTGRQLPVFTTTAARRLVALSAALALLAGWLVYAHVTSSGGHALAWRDVTARLPHATFDRPTVKILDDESQLEQFLARAMPGRAPQTPRFDFSHDELLLVAAGPRSSTGYSVAIEGVVDEPSRILVRAREHTPSLGDPVAPRVTYPYRLIAFPRSDKSVFVEWQGRP